VFEVNRVLGPGFLERLNIKELDDRRADVKAGIERLRADFQSLHETLIRASFGGDPPSETASRRIAEYGCDSRERELGLLRLLRLPN